MAELLAVFLQILVTNPLTVILVVLGAALVALAIIGKIPPIDLTDDRARKLTKFGLGLIGSGVIVALLLAWASSNPATASPRETPLRETDFTATPSEVKSSLPSSTPVVIAPTSAFTPTPVPTETPIPWIVYNFETGVEGWITSEGEHKLATLTTTTEITYFGAQALMLQTELIGKQSNDFEDKGSKDVFPYTEAVAYFNSSIPEGFSELGPYNLKGKTVSCYVYMPSQLFVENEASAYVRIFVKDAPFYKNQIGVALFASETTTNRWLKLSLTVGDGQGEDGGFDPTQISALGVRFDLLDDSTLSFEGSIYIDACSIEHL